MGPILPQLTVFGKQLGLAPDVMGLITSILPILYVVAKPIVGFVIDYFTVIIILTFLSLWLLHFLSAPQHMRKIIFMLIILITALSYSGFYFVPTDQGPAAINSTTFWMFVLLMSLGTINFNVGNCVSDAICFDVLGESGEMKYGRQRVWGTIGFGLTALIAGIAVDLTSTNSIGPALIVMIIFTLFDLISVTQLKVRTK